MAACFDTTRLNLSVLEYAEIAIGNSDLFILAGWQESNPLINAVQRNR